jgi:sortase (surface protein transpeptidase)
MATPDPATGEAGGRHRGLPRGAAGAPLATLLTLVLTVFGAALLAAAFSTTPQPQPPAKAAMAGVPKEVGTTTASKATAAPPGSAASGQHSQRAPGPAGRFADKADRARAGLPRSTPVGISIPEIDVDAKVMPVGLNRDRTLEVPSPAQADKAAWYELGPTPGQVGNSVIVGHLDSAVLGPAVFFRLGELMPGDAIEVSRRDGSVATFKVDGVKSYRKDNFPTALVYGPSAKPGLRLVTCAGPWNKETSYRDNTIVFATLASAER